MPLSDVERFDAFARGFASVQPEVSAAELSDDTTDALLFVVGYFCPHCHLEQEVVNRLKLLRDAATARHANADAIVPAVWWVHATVPLERETTRSTRVARAMREQGLSADMLPWIYARHAGRWVSVPDEVVNAMVQRSEEHQSLAPLLEWWASRARWMLD